MTRKPLLNRLDDAVRWTGIPAYAEGAPRRRPLRWPSTIALALAVGGFGVAISEPERPWIGYAALVMGFVLGVFMPIFGPLKPWGGTESVDERERAVRAKAYLIVSSAFAATAFIGLWLIVWRSFTSRASIDALRWSTIDLVFLLAATYTAGPTCFASWAERSIPDEAE